MKKRVAALAAAAAFCLLFTGCKISFHVVDGSNVDTDPGEVEVKTFSYEGTVSRISLEQRVGTVTIESGAGEELQVECSYPEKYMPTVTWEDGQLVIGKDAQETTAEDMDDWYTKITIPQEYTLSEMSLSLELGDVMLHEISCKELEAELNMGDMKLTDSSFSEADIHVDAGDVKGENTAIAAGTVHVDLGDIVLEGDIGNVKVSTDLGKLSVSSNDPET